MTPTRRPGPTVRLRVTEHVAGGERAHEDRVVTEEPLEIRLAAGSAPPRRLWVTMRTPGHDFELAAGFAVHEGLITPSSLRRVAYCTDEALSPAEEHNVVTLTVDHATDIGPLFANSARLPNVSKPQVGLHAKPPYPPATLTVV